MEFKQLELSNQGSWLKRKFWSRQAKKTYIAIIIGATAGFLFFYFSEGRHMDVITSGDVMNSVLIGGFLGFFITNSPCAKGAC